MNIKKIGLFLISISIAVIFIGVVSENVKADNAKLDFTTEPTYMCYKSNEKGYYYKIFVTIENSGDVSSCPMNIRIYEDGMRAATNETSCRGVIFNPNEEKKFTIEWMTPYPEKQIEIKFMPSNSINITKTNVGSTKLNVIYNDENNENNTPGFEICVLLISIILLIYIKKEKHK